MLSRRKLESVIAVIQRRLPELNAVYLFGSAARGLARPDSDVDLAVLAPRALGAAERFELELKCAEHLGTDVDVIDLRTAPLTLQAAVMGEGRRLFASAPREMDFFENTILSRYCAFNEERRPFFRAVAARGTIHA